MTIEQKLIEMLVSNGMFPDEVKQVMVAVRSKTDEFGMKGRWNDDIDGYPMTLLTGLWIWTRKEAVIWIDANCPLAWYRPMFAEDDL